MTINKLNKRRSKPVNKSENETCGILPYRFCNLYGECIGYDYKNN
jgi:hypothetical protein